MIKIWRKDEESGTLAPPPGTVRLATALDGLSALSPPEDPPSPAALQLALQISTNS